MNRTLRLLLALCACLGLIAAACGDDSEDSATEDTTDGDTAPDDGEAAEGTPIGDERCARNEDAGTITFVTGFDFAASAGIIDMIVADAEGYFDELCLDVDLQPGFAPSNAALVIEGQAQIGNAGGFAEMVANNEAGEGDLVAIMHWGRTAIEGMVIPADGTAEDFGDLCGATVGIKGDLPYSLQAAVALSGIERSCFDSEVLLDGFDPISHLDLGIDALPVYKSNEPNILDNAGVEYTLLDPLDFDVPASFGITFTTQRFIDENPDVVGDIVLALAKANEFAKANVEESVDHAFELIEATGNQLFLAKEAEVFRWGVESELIRDLTPEGQGPGIPDEELLGAEIEAMTSAGVFDETPDFAAMIDASFAEAVYDGDTLLWPGS